jgi:hypothetical protein
MNKPSINIEKTSDGKPIMYAVTFTPSCNKDQTMILHVFVSSQFAKKYIFRICHKELENEEEYKLTISENKIKYKGVENDLGSDHTFCDPEIEDNYDILKSYPDTETYYFDDIPYRDYDDILKNHCADESNMLFDVRGGLTCRCTYNPLFRIFKVIVDPPSESNNYETRVPMNNIVSRLNRCII